MPITEPESIARLRKKQKPFTPVELPEVEPRPELLAFEPEALARIKTRPIMPTPRLDLPEALMAVYPEFEFETEEGQVVLDIMLQWAEEDPNAFIEDIQVKGRTTETVALLEAFDATPEEIEQVFATEVIAPPSLEVPDWLTFDFWKEALFKPYAGEDLAGKAYFSFIAGIGDVITTTGGAARWLGYEDVGATLSAIGSKIQQVAPPPTTGEFEMADMLDPEWYATQVTRTIPFALSLAPLAIGGFYAGSGIATTLGLGRLGAWLVGGFVGAALSRPLESALEAGGQYDDAIARGKTEQEAKEEADEVFRNNMKLAGMDAFQIAIALAPTPKWVPTSLVRAGLVRTTRIAGKMVIIGLTEGGEEVYQDMVQRHARGEEWQLDPVSKEVFAIGMTMGLGMGLGGDVVTGLADNVKKKMTPEIKGDFDTAVEGWEAQGFTTEQAELKALDTISQTPEGEKIVTETLKELQEAPEVAEVPARFAGIEEEARKAREGQIPWEGIPNEERMQAEWDVRQIDQVTIENVRDARVVHPTTGKEVPAGLVTNIKGDQEIVINKELIRETSLIALINSDPALKGKVTPSDFNNSKGKFTEFLLEHEKQHLYIREEGWFYPSELEERLINKRALEAIGVKLEAPTVPVIPEEVAGEGMIRGAPEVEIPKVIAGEKGVYFEEKGEFISEEWREELSKLDSIPYGDNMVYFKKGNQAVAKNFIKEAEEIKAGLEAWAISREEAAIRFGKILGYSEKDIQFFISSSREVATEMVGKDILRVGAPYTLEKDGYKLVKRAIAEGKAGVEIKEASGETFFIPIAPELVAKPPVAKKVEPEIPEVIGEGGIPVPPEEPIAQGVIDSTPIVGDIGAKELVRPTRKVFERLGLYELYKGIQGAEVAVGEERVTRQKEQRGIMKSVDKAYRKHGLDKSRYANIFDEVNERGSQPNLIFEEKQAVTYIRNWANEWADRKNLPAEKRIKDYIPHLFEQEMTAEIKETGKISPELAMLLSDRVAKTITDPFLKERLGAVGFLKDPFRAMEAYDAAAMRVFHYEPFLQKIAAIGNDPMVPHAVRDYMKDYSRRMTGEPSKLDLKINADIQELASKLKGLPGGTAFANYLEKGNVSGFVAYQYTGAIYGLWLGFKFTSAIRNLSQHTLIIGEVGPVHFANAIKLRFTREGKSALRKSLVLRSRKAAFVPGIDDSFAEQWTDKFRETALWMFRMADKQNVSDAFLAGYSEAKSLLPNADEQVWIDRGDEVAADTQYLYTKMNSMAISQSSVGRVFSILTTWSENWVELMSKWIARRPSQVYLEHEKVTGEKTVGANWSTSVKAIGIYMVIVGLGFILKTYTRLKAWEYTGITSIRYLADVIGGDFPGLQAPGAIANMVAGFITDDDRMFKEGWYDFKSTFTPGIIRQLNAVMAGDKDWLTLLLYLEGRDWKLKKLKNEWKKDFEVYDELPDRDRDEYRKNNYKIEAKLFVVSRFTKLLSDEARAEVLRLIEKHDLDTELIKGYEKVFGVDTQVELDKFQNRVGNLEKLEVGVEAEYYTMSDFASEVNTLVKNMGRTKVEKDGNQLAIEYLRAKDLFVQYDSLEGDARKQYRLQFPDVEALMYLFGHNNLSAFQNPNSAVELLRLMKKYDISPEGIKAFVDDPAKYDALQAPLFQLQLEWNDMLMEYELLDKDERELMLEQNPDFRDARRHIEAINMGIPPKQIGNYIEYYAKPIEGYDQERFLQAESLKPEPNYYTEVWLGILENEEKDFSKVPTVEFESFFNDTYMEAEIGDDRYGLRVDNLWFDEEGVRLGKWKPWDARYEGMPPELIKLKKAWDNKINEYNLADDARQETMLLDTKFRDAKRRIEAYDKEIPTALHDDYVGYYAIPSAGYENERYLMEHMGLVDTMVALGYWEPKDFSNVPTVEFEKTLPEYEKLPVGSARYKYRGDNLWFDEEGVRLGRWKAWKKPEAKPKAEKPEWEESIEDMEEKLKQLRLTPPSEIDEDADKYLDEFSPEEVLDAVNALPEDIMVGTKENYSIPLDASIEDLTERQIRDLAGFLYFTGPQGQWGKRMAGYLEDADNLGLLEELGILRNINPQHLTGDEARRLTGAVEEAHRKELVDYMKPELDKAQTAWFKKWGVPESERTDWKNHLLEVDPSVWYGGAYLHIEGKEELITPEIRLHPNYVKAGVIAHEFAHANYFENIPDSMLKYYPVAHALAQAISPMYVDAILKYPGGEDRARLPVEGYAEAYRRLAEGKEQLPWYLEPFYGNLLFEIPDLPGDWEKSALAWLAYWMKYKLNIK